MLFSAHNFSWAIMIMTFDSLSAYFEKKPGEYPIRAVIMQYNMALGQMLSDIIHTNWGTNFDYESYSVDPITWSRYGFTVRLILNFAFFIGVIPKIYLDR